MIEFIKYKWKNGSCWEKRNLIWSTAFFISLFSMHGLAIVVTATALIVDAFVSGTIETYKKYKEKE